MHNCGEIHLLGIPHGDGRIPPITSSDVNVGRPHEEGFPFITPLGVIGNAQ